MKKIIIAAALVFALSAPAFAGDRGSAASLKDSAHAVATEVPPSKVSPGNMPNVPTATEVHDCPDGQYWHIDHCEKSPVIHPNPNGQSGSNGPGPLPIPGQGGNSNGNNSQNGQQQGSNGGGLGQQQPPAATCPQGTTVGLGGFCATPANANGKCPPQLKKASDGKCYSKADYKKIK